MKEKVRNKKVIYIIISIVSVLLIAIGLTYAYWLVTRSQTDKNLVTTKCFDLSLTDEKNDITLLNQFPISDEDGLRLTPYTFTLTNTCDNEIDYRIALEILGNESEMITSNGIKVNLNGNMGILDTFNEIDPTIKNAYESRAIGYGSLAAAGNKGDSATFELRLWIDKNASIKEMNKTFKSKISVTTGQGMDSVYHKGTLAYDIVSKYGGTSATTKELNNTELIPLDFTVNTGQYYFGDTYEIDLENGTITLTGEVITANLSDCYKREQRDPNGPTLSFNYCPQYAISISNEKYTSNIIYKLRDQLYNVSDEGADAYGFASYHEIKHGLYKTEDDLGTSYYYRGNVENNYMKIMNRVYREEIIPAQEAEEAYISSDFTDISTICKEDTDCIQETNAIKSMIFTSEEDCITAGEGIWTTCEKQEEINELYFPTDTTVESMLTIGYLTEDECTSAGTFLGWTTCEKRKLKEATPEIDNSRYEDVETYWRIVRVNGDGTVRLIYDGDNLYENGIKHTATITLSIEEWFEKNIKNTTIEPYIADTVFCKENFLTKKGEVFTGPYVDAYSDEYIGFSKISKNNVSLYCGDNQYKYTVNNEHGNKQLKYPIDELNAYEVVLATNQDDSLNYLSTGDSFATSTIRTAGVEAVSCCVSYNSHGCHSYGYCSQKFINTFGVNEHGILMHNNSIHKRPVINLVADVPFTGSGTIIDPYVIGE